MLILKQFILNGHIGYKVNNLKIIFSDKTGMFL